MLCCGLKNTLTIKSTTMKKYLKFFLVLPLFIWSCSSDSDEITTELNSTIELENSANDHAVFSTFKVTIENIGQDQDILTLFSPGVYVVQKQKSEPLFDQGEEDYGMGLEAIAEDGMPGPLNENLENHPKIRSHGIFATPVGASGPAPLTPGEEYEFTITAKHKDYLNFVTMYVQSNDVFIAPMPQGISLFNDIREPIEGDITGYLYYWDAGTEVNQEPGVGSYQAPRQPAPDTGTPENGVVHLLDDGYYYPPLESIIRVTISLVE